MKPIAFAIFAHPDDESFGPAGTLAQLTQTHDVHLITITSGNAQYTPNIIQGTWNIVYKDDRATQREQEVQSAAHILGIKHVHLLHWDDGSLSNARYHELAHTLQSILNVHKPELLITFEPRGLSGHIDHIVTTSVVNFLLSKLSYVKRILYFCFNTAQRQAIDDGFVFCPHGYEDDEIDLEIDVSSVWEQRVQAIKAHGSQQKDIGMYLPQLEALPKKEYFLIRDIL